MPLNATSAVTTTALNPLTGASVSYSFPPGYLGRAPQRPDVVPCPNCGALTRLWAADPLNPANVVGGASSVL